MFSDDNGGDCDDDKSLHLLMCSATVEESVIDKCWNKEHNKIQQQQKNKANICNKRKEFN